MYGYKSSAGGTPYQTGPMRFTAVLAVLVTGSFATKEFQCWNFKQEDTIRVLYHNAVNNLRSSLALGNADNKDNQKCPKGSNIYRLEWDCILENYAQKAVDQCKDNPTVPDKLSMVYKAADLTTCNPTPLFAKQIQEWWNVVKNVGLDAQANFASGLEDFATLAHGKATRIGCAQKNCNGKLHMACMVYPKRAVANGKVPMGSGGTTRPCAKMMRLNYNCTLEKEAYDLGKLCNQPEQTPYINRNMNFFISSKSNAKEAADEALAKWYEEIKTGRLDQATGAGNLLKPDLKIDSFARMVWAENIHVGCAVISCNGKSNVVCKYDPTVGIYGNTIYRPGAASCRQCATACDNGLCTA
ncbi:hypothetical protein Y032_0009g455 [Ancylostoma ceylanicum]|uniref:SCP domain-containing protein n=2 Tax=Ancylostoma ceylanicum TaxID=53326 RepID=A0A016VI55_9BILA|nr:hypothetical protein Y032_0009g455 [Ancylostoma ceylanicum]